MEVKVLKCENCGSVLEQTNNKEILFCPYCGAKTLITESDAIKIKEIERKTAEEHEKTIRMTERLRSISKIIENLKDTNEFLAFGLVYGGLALLIFLMIIIMSLLF